MKLCLTEQDNTRHTVEAGAYDVKMSPSNGTLVVCLADSEEDLVQDKFSFVFTDIKIFRVDKDQ